MANKKSTAAAPNKAPRSRESASLGLRIDRLPPLLRKEAMDYVEFLEKKHRYPRSRKALKFSWAGCLSHLKDRYTAVDLQHKALEWR